MDDFVPTAHHSNMSGDYLTGLVTNLVSDALTSLLGAVLNLWLLAGILTSRSLREKPRNQILSSISILNLIRVFYFVTLQVLHNAGYPSLIIYYTKCSDLDKTNSVDLMVSVAVKYTLLVLYTVYLEQVEESTVALSHKSLPKVSWVTHVTSLVLPWVIGFITVNPSLAELGFGGYPCLPLNTGIAYTLLVFNFLLPIGLSIGIIARAVVILRCEMRGHCGTSSTFEMRCCDRRTANHRCVDNLLAYIAALAICVLCDVCQIVRFVGLTQSTSWG